MERSCSKDDEVLFGGAKARAGEVEGGEAFE